MEGAAPGLGSADRPFVDRPVGVLPTASAAARRVAHELELSEPQLIRTGMNAIFRSGDVVLRVGHPTAPVEAAIELASVLSRHGIRVVHPSADQPSPRATDPEEPVVSVWEHIADTGAPIDWAAIGAMVRRLHRLDPATIPSVYPVPFPTRFPWWDFAALLDELGPAIDDDARAGIEAAIARWPNATRFERVVVCHGDVHPGNVIMSVDGPVLIDWDLLCAAPPGWDHAPMMTWAERWGGAPGEYDRYAEGYGWSARGDTAAEAFAELRLVAATLMRVKAAIREPVGPDGSDRTVEVERRLRYWRGDESAPMWRAQ